MPKATIETLDIVLCQGSMFHNKKQIRRCKEITEIVGMTDKGELDVNTVYLYNFQKDAPSFSGTSQMYASIAEKTGMNMTMMGEDIRKSTAVLQAMLDQDIRDFARIVWLFLSRPKYVMANVTDLTQILPGKCKIHEALANRPINKDEYPELVDGLSESDAAYKTVSSVSDRIDDSGAARVCLLPDTLDVTPEVEESVATSGPVPVSGEQTSIVDSVTTLDSAEPGVTILPDVVLDSSSPDVVPEPEMSDVGASSDDVEDFFFDIHAPIRSNEDIFGPFEPDPESIFEVAPEKEISSFDLYADEQNTDPSPEKK